MTLTVLNVAYPLAPVGLDAVGGAEQVLAQVERAAVEAGHRSVVIACEDSEAVGHLITIHRPQGVIEEETRAAAHCEVKSAIARALTNHDVDVMHFHGIDFAEYLPETGPPSLVTLHLPPHWYPDSIWQNIPPKTHLHCVSESQEEQCPNEAPLWPVIGNGVDLASFRPRWRKFGFALMLGRICPEKGIHLALDAATQAGIPLWIGGEVFEYETHRRYFEQEVRPRIEGTCNRFLGPLRLKRKRQLLRAARCVLIPSLAPETSSLVAMEALACATPVIAFPSGALSQMVEHGHTGFLVNDTSEMAAAMRRVKEIDLHACRAAAETRFSSVRMTAAYLGAYRRAFEEDWRELYDACPYATPFGSPEWLSGWPLEFVRVRRAGRLVAIAGLGSMDISDYRDILTLDDTASQQLWEKLPTCTLEEIPPDSPFLPALPVASEDASWCPVVNLPALQLPPKLAKNLRLQRRKLETAGGEFEVASPDQANEYLDALFALHEQRWSANGALREPDIRAFHRRVAPAFAGRGWLRFHGIRRNGKLEAVLYAFARNRRVYYYLSGFNPELTGFGPGSLLVHEAMQYALAQGDREFDFLRGVEPYKYRWGAVNRINKRVRKQ